MRQGEDISPSPGSPAVKRETNAPNTPLLNGPARTALATGAAVAAAVAFAWASQSKQDEAIMRNAASIAVIETKLETIVEKLEEIRALLERVAPDARRCGEEGSEGPEKRDGDTTETFSRPHLREGEKPGG